jgi:hypothetical protein
MKETRYKIPCGVKLLNSSGFCNFDNLCPACSEIKRLQVIILNLSLKTEINDKSHNSIFEADKGGIIGGDIISNEKYPKKEKKKQAKTKEKTNGMQFSLGYKKSLNADSSNLMSIIHYLETRRNRKVIKPQTHLPKLKKLISTFQKEDGDPHAQAINIISANELLEVC